MQRFMEQIAAVCHFADIAQIHDHNPVAEMPDHTQIMRDKEIGQVLARTQFIQQLQDLRLHRHVQGGYAFIQHHKLRVQGNGAGNAHSLLLSAGQGVRIDIVMLPLEPDFLQKLHDPLLAYILREIRVDHEHFLNGLSDGLRGSRLAAGSWKIICMSRRSRRISFRVIFPRLIPVS